MQVLPSAFISFNPNSEFEQTLAIRLVTIGGVHGLDMQMPNRGHSSQRVSLETRSRILTSDFFILFSIGSMSPTVREEIDIAFSKFHDRSRILVIYDKKIGKNFSYAKNCTEVFIDTSQDVLKSVNDISAKINSQLPKAESNSFLSSLSGLLLVGLGLLALKEILDEDQRPKKRPRKKLVRKKRRS